MLTKFEGILEMMAPERKRPPTEAALKPAHKQHQRYAGKRNETNAQNDDPIDSHAAPT
jgi:hypothetical protein